MLRCSFHSAWLLPPQASCPVLSSASAADRTPGGPWGCRSTQPRRLPARRVSPSPSSAATGTEASPCPVCPCPWSQSRNPGPNSSPVRISKLVSVSVLERGKEPPSAEVSGRLEVTSWVETVPSVRRVTAGPRSLWVQTPAAPATPSKSRNSELRPAGRGAAQGACRPVLVSSEANESTGRL